MGCLELAKSGWSRSPQPPGGLSGLTSMLPSMDSGHQCWDRKGQGDMATEVALLLQANGWGRRGAGDPATAPWLPHDTTHVNEAEGRSSFRPGAGRALPASRSVTAFLGRGPQALGCDHGRLPPSRFTQHRTAGRCAGWRLFTALLTRSRYVDQAGLELMILTQPPKCWDYRPARPTLVKCVLMTDGGRQKSPGKLWQEDRPRVPTSPMGSRGPHSLPGVHWDPRPRHRQRRSNHFTTFYFKVV
jgi:hypothetical protein